jgi:hypothetical protein
MRTKARKYAKAGQFRQSGRSNRRPRAMYKGGCAASPEGDSITLKLTDESGKSCELVLTFDEASSLAMTLPRLLGMALRQKYSGRRPASCLSVARICRRMCV